jgi:hypothetical protein
VGAPTHKDTIKHPGTHAAHANHANSLSPIQPTLPAKEVINKKINNQTNSLMDRQTAKQTERRTDTNKCKTQTQYSTNAEFVPEILMFAPWIYLRSARKGALGTLCPAHRKPTPIEFISAITAMTTKNCII